MQKWLIPSNIKKFDAVSHFENNERIDWLIQGNWKIGDLVYIYVGMPIKKIMFKTIIENEVSYVGTTEKGACLRLIKKMDSECLSFENLLQHGLKGNIRGKMNLSGELEEYVDKCFKDPIEYNTNRMWLIEAGEKRVLIDEFKKHNVIVIGKLFEDLTGKSNDEIRKLCQETYPNENIDYKVSLINKFINEIKVDDYVLSYNKLKNEIYLGKCISNYYFADKIDYSNADGCYKHCRDVEWLCTIKYDDLSDDTKKSFKIPQTILEISGERKKEILDYKPKPFQADKNLNMNLIYFGAPGTGKSHLLNDDKNNLIGKENETNYERVTFHPDYTYANFVGTYKPVPKDDGVSYLPVMKDDSISYVQVPNEDSISYEYVPGPFMRILVKALKNPSDPFVLIIEEINRANVAAVFGDVFQLLDRDEDNNYSKFPINSSEDMKNYLKKELNGIKCIEEYLKGLLGDDFSKIRIPSNMFIWATMNSADQGVFPMDTAFKRRWDFKYLSINENESELKDIEVTLNNKNFSWNEIRRAINDELISFGINEDKLMGPFFAFKNLNENLSKKELTNEFKEIFKNKIIMYLFEDVARARKSELFKGAQSRQKNKDNITYYQICNDFDENGLKIFSKNIRKELGLD